MTRCSGVLAYDHRRGIGGTIANWTIDFPGYGGYTPSRQATRYVVPVFHVYLNGKKVSTAGVGDLGVLGAHVYWVRRKGKRTRSKNANNLEEELTLQVAGLTSPAQEHLRWLERGLKLGDEVRIKVGAGSKIDRPRSRYQRDPYKEMRSQKRYVRQMAKKFGWKIQTQS